MAPLSVGVLISGRGSNLQALLDACAAPGFPARIALVVSNKSEAQGLERARRAGVPIAVVSHRDHASRDAFDRALDGTLRAHGVEFVCLAGFMRLLSDWFVTTWRDRLINIHPSLLPSFRGLDAQAQALAAGVRLSGCTVHFVRSEMDAGPILAQAAVPVLARDTVETLSVRILEAEHRCYPHALRLVAEGRARVIDERVVLDGAEATGMLMNPPGP